MLADATAGAAAIAAAGAQACLLDELLAQSDVITLHCPATAQTRRMIDDAAIAKMKPGVILVNLARGALVDSAALVAALQSNRIGAAALDVFDPEPVPSDSPLLRMDNVILAAHIASASPKAAKRLRETVADIAARCVRGEFLPNVVNGVVQSSVGSK